MPQIGINTCQSTTKQPNKRVLNLTAKQDIKSKGGKIKRIDNPNPYLGLDPNICPDHPSMRGGKIYDVDKDIDQHKKIDPAKVFENYKEMKNGGPEKNKKKIRRLPPQPMKVGGKNVTIKYAI